MQERGVGRLSVVVVTYNRADYLRLCLACLLEADYAGPWEIVVSDDGSTDATPDVIEEARRTRADVELRHVWHEHQRYRRAFALNEGARNSIGDLLVFLDSDCLPTRELLRVYAEHARPNAFYLGGVLKLTEAFSRRALAAADGLKPQDLLAEAAESASLAPGARKRLRARYWQSRLHAALGIGRPRIWGGNFAINRETLEAVNGLDETFVGYGQEDSDLRNRLVLGGYRPVPIHTRAIAYHLWHPANLEARQEASGAGNNRPYADRPTVEVVCTNGLRKLGG